MPPKQIPKPSASIPNPKKRKDPPHSTSKTDRGQQNKKHKPNDHRAKQRDARQLATQTTSKAFANGALDVDKFVKAREYEIQALEQGMLRSKGALNRRAFQQVPTELRRRGAAHDVKRVPKRLRGRAAREMVEDNTPTVRKGKGVGKGKGRGVKRLRIETVKKLRALGVRRVEEGKKKGKGVEGSAPEKDEAKGASKTKDTTKIATRTPKVKQAELVKVPTPKAKFRKRQKHKSWLPTHIFHAKRAHMTPPSAPMWRFALPLSPTQKSYRPTHRASSERGVVCWDTSYTATIGLEGEERSVLGMLRALGVEHVWLTDTKGRKWRAGTRVLETMVCERGKPHRLIAPVTVIWSATTPPAVEETADEASKIKRKLFLRVHPSAFFELWEELDRLSKVAKPAVHVEDLRWELGSIELKGPGSTEALLGALWPSPINTDGGVHAVSSVESTWTSLTGLTHAGMLPAGAMLAFSVQDPKLHFPPRTIKSSGKEDGQTALLELLADWPVDFSQQTPAIFDQEARHLGSRLPSQKAVNRRKGLANPGEYAEPRPEDPHIPILLYASTSAHSVSKQHQPTSWHLLAPWKTIQPIWYSLMYYPLSTGQQPRFGGLDERRQLAFEAGTPWFPGDFPGTRAGWDWEVLQRRKRWEEWKRRPKGKRVRWESVQVGVGKEGRGEVGLGWACGWEMLVGGAGEEQATGESADKGGADEQQLKEAKERPGDVAADKDASSEQQPEEGEGTSKKKKGPKRVASPPEPPPKPRELTHLPSASAITILNNPASPLPTDISGKLLTIRLTLLTRGVPQTCARIYRLPSSTTNPKLRKSWLALHPCNQPHHKQKKHALPRMKTDTPPHIFQQRLAASLLEPPKAGGDDYPACPGKEDLVGFVTSGNFNLAEGRGTGVGCVLFEKVVEQAREGGVEERLCIVRNAGENVGRLGRWDVV